jgi:H+-transporting ATPase
MDADPVPAGLTTAEAQARLEKDGPNSTPSGASTPWRRAAGKFFGPIPCMLEAAIVLQLVLGAYVQAGVLGLLVACNAALGLFQEARATATLEALKSRLALLASVRRDGAWKTLPAAELVRGDIVKISLGGVVPADVRIGTGNILLDQSTLTGESLPIEGGPGLETYAGALVRRGEAVAEVVATGMRTKFGQTAELVRTAHTVSSQQKAVLRVVRNLAFFNGVIVLVQWAYALHLGIPAMEIIPLILTAVLAAIPMALPASFTLATAIGARSLARQGVLPTRLSAIDEAATMDVLCADKTGTLTQNSLEVTEVCPMPGFDRTLVLAYASLASSDGGQDPVDSAIRAASKGDAVVGIPTLTRFVPFDPTTKTAEALASGPAGQPMRIVKGAFATVHGLAKSPEQAASEADALQAKGYRVLAVAAGPVGAMSIAGLVALSDPPRGDSAQLVGELLGMGVHMVMLTGDSPATAGVIARVVGIRGAICPPGPPPGRLRPEDYAVFAGIFPKDKFDIIKAFQNGGHTVGMCGDGANDAPALRQAQIGIAVFSATDVAKSAAGMVLTESGLGGIVSAVTEGRVTFQRILTYTLRSLTRKIDQMLFLTVGLFMTGHAILTPTLMVIMMTTGDILAMSSTTDNVRPSTRPNHWRVDNLTIAAVVLGSCNLVFCSAILALGIFHFHLDTGRLQTLAALTLVFSGQAVFYVARERRRFWSSRPSLLVVLSSLADVAIISVLSTRGIFMAALPAEGVALVLVAAAGLTFVLDAAKGAVFEHLKMS